MPGIDGEVLGPDIDEDGSAIFPQDRAGRRHIAERSGDNLAAYIEGFKGKLERDGSIAYERKFLAAKKFPKAFFKFKG